MKGKFMGRIEPSGHTHVLICVNPTGEDNVYLTVRGQKAVDNDDIAIGMSANEAHALSAILACASRAAEPA